MEETGRHHPTYIMKNINISSRNLINSNGNPTPNQIEIRIIGETEDGKKINIKQFNSYDKKILLIDYTGENPSIAIDAKAFDYSVTTSKYLNIFLRNNYLNPEDIKKIYKVGSGKLTTKYNTYNIIIMDLNK